MDDGKAAAEDCGNGVEAMTDGGSNGHTRQQLDNDNNNGSRNSKMMTPTTTRQQLLQARLWKGQQSIHAAGKGGNNSEAAAVENQDCILRVGG